MPRTTAAANAAPMPVSSRPRSRGKHKVCTAEEAAVLDFQPWTDTTPLDRELIHSRLQVVSLLIPFCNRLMFMTKLELEAEIATWTDEKGDLIRRTFFDGQDFLETALKLLSGAEARIIVAGSSLVIKRGNQ